MATVEELREIINAINEQCEKDLPYQTGLMADVDSIIAAAEERERERILKPLLDKHWNSKAEELRFGIIQDEARLAFLGGKHPEMSWGELEHHYGYSVVDSFIMAIVVQERERIRSGSKYLDCSDENDAFSYALSFWHVPASVLTQSEPVIK